jgi:photosystem II stability/assembly factor-like uncharacterized protein
MADEGIMRKLTDILKANFEGYNHFMESRGIGIFGNTLCEWSMIKMRKRYLPLLLFVIYLASPLVVKAEDRFVPAVYPTIQEAIDVAESGDVIKLAEGTFRENVFFRSKTNVTLEGGYAPDYSERDPSLHITVVDGTQAGSAISIKSSISITIDGLFITNGLATDNGGGIHCYESSAVISNNVITKNKVMGLGTVTTGFGGGIYFEKADLLVTSNTISYNESTKKEQKGGGGIAMFDSSGTLQHNTVTGNTSYNGGGIYCAADDIIISANVISENQSKMGGGFYVYSSSPIIANNIVAGNVATYAGASIYCDASSPMVTNCTFVRNFTKGIGNVILDTNAMPTISNSLFWQNNDGIVFETTAQTSITYSNIADQRFVDKNGNIALDPLFVDLEAGDYRLTHISPCVDAGNPSPGDNDIGGSRNDMGAFGGPGAADWGAMLPLVPAEILVFDEAWDDFGLYGGQISSISIDPGDTNHMFATSYMGDGLFVTSDQGAGWQFVPGFRNIPCSQVIIDKTNPLRVWVTFDMFIAKSYDRGITWSKWGLPDRRFANSIAIHPHEGSTVYIGAGGADYSDKEGTIYKTEDGGSSWQQLNIVTDEMVTFLAINPSRPQEIWAITGAEASSVYNSFDGGVTWALYDFGAPPGFDVDQIVFDPQDPQTLYASGSYGVWKSSDGGGNWDWLGLSDFCNVLALDPNDPNIVYAATYSPDQNYFFVSPDAGATWAAYSINNLGILLAIAISPDEIGRLFAGTIYSGVFASQDSGQTWTAINHGIKAVVVYDSAVNLKKPAELLVGTIAGLFLKDEQNMWHQLTRNSADAVAYDPFDSRTIYAGQDLSLAKSIDAGETWVETYITIGGATYSVASIAIDSSNSQVLYLGTGHYAGNIGHVCKSLDGGQNVESVLALNVPVNTVTIDPSDRRMIYAGSGMFYASSSERSGGLYKSKDAGASWSSPLLSGLVVNSIQVDPKNPDIVYAACGDSMLAYRGLYKSVDAGASWEDKSFVADAVTEIKIDQHKPQWIYAATFTNGIFLSIDGGENWTNLGLTEYVVNDLSIYKTANNQKAQQSSIFSAAASEPSNQVLAGTNSGIVGYTGSTIYGMIYRFNSTEVIYPADAWLDVGSDKPIQALVWDTGHYLIAKPPVGDNYILNCETDGFYDQITGISVWSMAELNYDFHLKLGSLPSPEPPSSDSKGGGGGGGGGCMIDSVR